MENTETVTLYLAEPQQVDSVTQYALDLTKREATLLIHDNDSAPNVWIDSVVNASEPDSGGKFILKRNDISRELTINFRFDQYNSSAKYNTDFTIPGLPYEEWYDYDSYYWEYYAEPGIVTFAQGSDTAEIFVNVMNNSSDPNETVTIRLAEPPSIDGVLQYSVDSVKRHATLLIHGETPVPVTVPTVWIDSVVNASEPNGNGKFILKRSDVTNALTVNFSFNNDRSTGSYDSDFIIAGLTYYWNPGTVTFAQGSDTAEVAVNVKDDAIVEDWESVTIRLNDPNQVDSVLQYTVDPKRQETSLYIKDNEIAPNIWIDEIIHGIEGSREAKVILKRDHVVGALTVTLSRTGGTANNSTDYNGFNDVNITFADGSDTADYTIVLKEDTVVEQNETITARLRDPAQVNGVLQYMLDETKRNATILIHDTDIAPQVWIDSVVHVTEPNGQGKFILKRSDITHELTINFSFDYNRSTASYDSDFTIAGLTYYWNSGTVTFAQGSDTVEVLVNAKDDSIVENYETVIIRLNDPNQNSTGTVTFLAGEDTTEIVIKVNEDAVVENSETVIIRLADPTITNDVTKYAIDPSKQRATLLIHNDLAASTVWIDSVVHSSEPDSNGKFILKRDGDTSRELTIQFRFDASRSNARYNHDFTIAGLPYEEWYENDSYYWEYYAEPGTATFAAGSDTAEIVAAIKDDTTIERTETVTIRLVAPNAVNGKRQYEIDELKRSATLLITDNDPIVKVWVDSVQNGKEGNPDGFFQLRRDNTQNAVSVNYSLSGKAGNGNDYQLLNGWVTFEAGQEFVEIPISVIDDELIEDDFELVLLTLNPYSVDGIQQYTLDPSKEFPVTASLTIQDNDIPGNVWIDAVQNATEGDDNGDGWFRLRRDQVKGSQTIHYTVTGTATTTGSDYTKLTGTVTFNDGDEFVYVPISVVNDNFSERDETITLTLISNRVDNHDRYYFENTAEHPASATITLFDNDRTNVWLEKEQDTVKENETEYFVIRRDNVVNELSVRLGFDKKLSTATLGEDFNNPLNTNPKSNFFTVTFGVGEDTIRIPITALGDDLIEDTESIVLEILTAPENNFVTDEYARQEGLLPIYIIDAINSAATINIQDNDVKPQVWFETKQDATEGQENGYARVWRSDATNALRISYRINDTSTGVSGQDYDYPPGMSALNNETGFITFAKGAYYVDIPIRVINNSLLDGTRTVSITIIPGDETVGGVNTIYDIDD